MAGSWCYFVPKDYLAESLSQGDMMKSRKALFAVILSVATIVSGSLSSNAQSVDASKQEHAAVPFLQGVSVRINGHGPYLFGLDTGISAAFLIDPALSKDIALPITGHTHMHTFSDDGAAPEVDVVHANLIEIGGVAVHDAIGMPLPNSSPMVKEGKGTLGMALFKDQTLHLDYASDRLWLSEGALPTVDGHTTIAYTDSHLRPFVEISLNGLKVVAGVDTGARSIGVDLTIPIQIANQLPLIDRKTSSNKLTDINGNEYKLETATLDGDLKIGDLVVHHPSLMVGDFLDVEVGERKSGRRVTSYRFDFEARFCRNLAVA